MNTLRTLFLLFLIGACVDHVSQCWNPTGWLKQESSVKLRIKMLARRDECCHMVELEFVPGFFYFFIFFLPFHQAVLSDFLLKARLENLIS